MVHRLILITHEISLAKPALVCGLEAMEYKENTTDENPSLAYVSKIDTTGYKAPAPLTSILVKTYLPSLSDCTVHIFARAQPQYLFPQSVKNTNKRIQTDRGLIAWWLRAITDAPFVTKLDAWWCIPGVDDQESAKRETGVSQDLKLGHVNWHYGYPYDHNADAKAVIPKFPDDAKCRLLQSYAAYDKEDDSIDEEEEEEEEEEVEHDGDDDQDDEEGESKADEGKDMNDHGDEDSTRQSDSMETRRQLKDIMDDREPQAMTVREFWELLSIGEECGAGKLAGFFVIKGKSSTIDTAEETLKKPAELARSVTEDQFTRIWNHLMSLDFESDESNRESTEKITQSIIETLLQVKEDAEYAPAEVVPTGDLKPDVNKLKRPMQQELPSAPVVNVLGGSFIKRKRT
ncbi:hypothetical protein Unana1_06158 [Umbelopsis nana]